VLHPLKTLLSVVGIPHRPEAWNPTWDVNQRGSWGEQWACWYYYHHRKAAILDRNWRGGGGEIDLLVREKDTLVVVEIKTRDPKDPDPLSAVRDDKRLARLHRAGLAYHQRLPRPRPALRFDAFLVTPTNDERPQFNLLEDLFDKDESE